MNLGGKNEVKRYLEGHIEVYLSFQFGTIWSEIGGVIQFQS